MPPLRHFLIVFDMESEKLISGKEYANADEATRAYAEAEQEHGAEQKHGGEWTLEIVLIGADSIETVRRSHSNYFESVADSPYLVVA